MATILRTPRKNRTTTLAVCIVLASFVTPSLAQSTLTTRQDNSAPVTPTPNSSAVITSQDAAANRLAAADRSTKQFFRGGSPRSYKDLVTLQERIFKLSGELVERTVAVQVGRANGSGVIVSEDGYVLTAAHVAGKPNQDAYIFLSNGRRLHGKTLGMNEVLDSGLIKITDKGPWPYAPLGKSSNVRIGQWCLATGHPGGYDPNREPVLRFGRILKTEGRALLSDCTLVGGDSGGPLFDLEGRVIAIHSRIGKNLTVNLHVPVDNYRKSWESLVNGSVKERLPSRSLSWIGVKENQEVENGVFILEVTDGSPAQLAGIQPGDEVVIFDGINIAHFNMLRNQVQRRTPGDQVKVQVRRAGDLYELELQIGSLSRDTKR